MVVSLAEPDPYTWGEGLVNWYTSTRTIGMHLRHRATHIRDVTIGLIVYYSYNSTVQYSTNGHTLRVKRKHLRNL